jgi:hypothetical protein
MNYKEDDFEDDLEDDNEDEVLQEVLLADFSWDIMPETISWEDPNFAKEITNRLKGITEEAFSKEVEIWQKAISILPKYSEFDIRKEINSWDFGTPGKNDFYIESYAEAYSRQVRYRTRLTEITSVVFAHYEMLTQANKTLKEMALKLSSGTAKDKDATAAFTVHPLTLPMTHAKRLFIYLEAVLKNIDFAAAQMDRMLREHQALSRINHSFNNTGMSQSIEESRTPMYKNNNNDNIIPGRKLIR